MTTATNLSRREELAQFLRSRRARLTPAAVGLPTGTRRRTPGLRREEVAQLAGVGVTWYTWLEQGRPINASTQILDAIARTLRLDQAEREHLYRLADVPEAPRDDEPVALPAEIQTILDGLVPIPAVVYSGRYDVLAWNAAYLRLFPEVEAWPVGERNALWQLFVTPSCCCRVVHSQVELPHMVATFRAVFGRHVGEPAWIGFVRRLSEASPEFAAMWAAHDVAVPGNRQKFFQNLPGGALLRTVSTSLAISAVPEARLVAYTPLGEADRALMERLVAGPPVVGLCPVHVRTAVAGAGSRVG